MFEVFISSQSVNVDAADSLRLRRAGGAQLPEAVDSGRAEDPAATSGGELDARGARAGHFVLSGSRCASTRRASYYRVLCVLLYRDTHVLYCTVLYRRT